MKMNKVEKKNKIKNLKKKLSRNYQMNLSWSSTSNLEKKNWKQGE